MTLSMIRPGLVLLLLGGLAACDPPSRLSQDDRDAVSDCRQEADRIFAVHNRYELSERDSSDTPFSANTLPSNPSAGLRDEYERDQLLDHCLAHSAAGEAVVPGTTPTASAP